MIFADANTNLAYCSYTEAGEIEYIFVHPAYRRKGYARQILAFVEERVQRRLHFQTPISPLGSALLAFYNRDKQL